jgi:hypothetical protein
VDRVDVQIIAYAPTVYYHCQHCEVTFNEVGLGTRVHREQAAASLPDDLRAEFENLTLRLHELAIRFGDRVRLRVVDAASIEGVLKALRWRVRKYPAVIIDGRRESARNGLDDLMDLVAKRLGEPAQRAVAEEEFGTRRS